MSVYNRFKLLKKELTEIACFNYYTNNTNKSILSSINELKKIENGKSKSNKILLLPLINDTAIVKMTNYFAKIIFNSDNYKIKYFYVPTFIDQPVQKDKMFAAIFYLKKYLQSYNYFKKSISLKNSDIIFNNYFLFYSKEVKKKFISKNEILNLKYNDINYGDLVYDSYLRYRGKPTINLTDDCLYDINEYAKLLIQKTDLFFKSNKNVTILLPYTSYLNWGIITRVALKNKQEVYTYGSSLYILNKIEIEYPYHSKNMWHYKPYFKLLENKEKRIEEAKIALEKRLTGEISKELYYMKKSSFDNNDLKFHRVNDNPFIVIFLHCFFDSPHIYGEGLFTDFYEWVNHILELALNNKKVNYYFKPHPNGLPENEEIIRNLEEKYKNEENIYFLDHNVSNLKILEEKPNAIVTYYGTVAHEFAYKNIPVIMTGDNPHISYNFIYNPKSIEEFNQLLLKPHFLKVPVDYKKNEILEFYYMHYLYLSKNKTILNFHNSKNFINGDVDLGYSENFKDLVYN